MMSKEELIAFEEDIAAEFNNAKIRALVHLSAGNEDQMIEAFKDIKENDWVLCSWRSHLQCLLKGVPPTQVKRAIMEGKSIALCFPEYKILSSGIVGGVPPIAVGLAMGIVANNAPDTVHCFVGDMTSETGIFHESLKYAKNYDLPVRFIIEDNNTSVCTDTRKVWNQPTLTYEYSHPKVYRYTYAMTKYPHSGAGRRIEF